MRCAKLLGTIFLAAAVLAFMPLAWAQQDLAPADAQIFAAVVRGAQRSGVVINNPCSSARFEVPNFIPLSKVPAVAFVPLGVDQNGAPNRGAWKEEVHEEGCGPSRVLNVLVVFDGSGKLTTRPMWPGSSRADPKLQVDGLNFAALAAGWPVKDCHTGYVEDTEYLGVEGPPLPGAKASPWQERWTLTACSTKSQIVMHFTPDPKGGTDITTARPQR